MANNLLGEVRRSHCVSTFGPGSIVEFRSGKEHSIAISGVIGGLEHWDKFSPPEGLQHEQVTYERRLQKLLNVDGFRLPPVFPEKENTRGYLIAKRFPKWLQCPKCNRIRHATKWDSGGPGDPAKFCGKCSVLNNRVFVSPVRFVVTCRRGHLDEFPWEFWIRHEQDCRKSSLKLYQSSKAGLAGLILECENCGGKKSMEGALGRETLNSLGLNCRGYRPWLEYSEPEKCDETPRAVQRGASNLYFPVVASALAIPPFTDSIQTKLDQYWQDFVKEPKEEWPNVIKYSHLEDKLGIPADTILSEVDRAMSALQTSGISGIRYEEYQKLSSDAVYNEQVDFDIRNEAVPPSLKQYFDKIVRVVRLREVRALRGFSRLNPPTGEFEDESPFICKISLTQKRWLPAIEVKGEGIFIRFNQESLERWESNGNAGVELAGRAHKVDNVYKEAWVERYGSDHPPPRTITPRFLLIHSFAHAVIRELTISSGYSSASLRERLYVDDKMNTAGLLIYTATTDSDGSLGGLERQALPERMNQLIPSAIKAIKWCSNDPLCIKDVSTFSEPQNNAACHSCMMVPETSCEEFNVLLDRAMLVGIPGNKDLGFFKSLINPIAEI